MRTVAFDSSTAQGAILASTMVQSVALLSRVLGTGEALEAFKVHP